MQREKGISEIAVQDDNAKEFTNFYAKYHERVFRYVRAMRFPFNHTNDLVSKVFERCWQRFTEYRTLESDKQNLFWVMRIAENVCSYEKRRLWKRGEILLEGVWELEQALERSRNYQNSEKSAEEEFLRKELLSQFMKSVMTLPRRQREVIKLRMEGFTYADIGGILRISDEACRRRMVRAVNSLKQKFSADSVAGWDDLRTQGLIWPEGKE